MKATTLSMIEAELVEARNKFPTNGSRFSALIQQMASLCTAFQKADKPGVKRQSVQVAAMAIRLLEESDAELDGKVTPFAPDGCRDTFYSGARAGMTDILASKEREATSK